MSVALAIKVRALHAWRHVTGYAGFVPSSGLDEPRKSRMPNCAQFRLSITRALSDQLAEALSLLTPAPLDMVQIDAIEPRGGVYHLYEDEILVYIGKADKSLQARLARHQRALSGRLHVGSMTFSCLYVDEDLHAVAPERLLIKRYRGRGQAPWNNNGFGNNDPGRRRDRTEHTPDHFDVLHPANLDWICEEIAPGRYFAAELLEQLKASLPYTFRYQPDDLHKRISLDIPVGEITADHLFQELGAAIAAEDRRWRITALPGRVIMYPDDSRYPSARKSYPERVVVVSQGA